jgi:YaeC family lipoprotein
MHVKCVLARLLAVAVGALLSGAARGEEQGIRVGVVPGPHARVMKVVQAVAAARGLRVEITVRRDPVRLNADLAAGVLDANSCQDLAALHADAHGYDLVDVAITITLPLAFYSRTARSFRELRPGDTVAIPRRPADAGRALILLHNYGLLQLRDDVGLAATPADVAVHRRGLKLVQIDAPRLARALDRVAAVAMTYPVAEAAGLQPARDGIGMEDGRSPWANVLVIRAEDRAKPWVAQLVDAYHSADVASFIHTEFRGSVRRPW